MEIKKSKVINVQGGGTWSPKDNPDKIFYKNEVEFENGDIGEYSSVKRDQDKFVVGQETDYQYIAHEKFPRVKPIYQKPQSFSSNGSVGKPQTDWADKDISIIRQSSLKASIEYLKGAEASMEELFNTAEQMIEWVNKRPSKTPSNTAKALHDFAKNPTGNNDDLPF